MSQTINLPGKYLKASWWNMKLRKEYLNCKQKIHDAKM